MYAILPFTRDELIDSYVCQDFMLFDKHFSRMGHRRVHQPSDATAG